MNSLEPQNSHRRNGGLDLLRAIAILLVVGHHLNAPWLPAWCNTWIFSRGALGVDIFFVLSGFLIGDQWFAALIGDRASFGEFYFRRALRILPAYFVMLVIYMTVVPEDLLVRTTPILLSRRIPLDEIWMYLGFFQNYFLASNHYSATWSLCVEEHFYLLFPMGAAFLHRTNPRRILPVISGILALSVPFVVFLWWHYPPENRWDFETRFYAVTHVRLFGIGYGVLFAAIKNYRQDLWRKITDAPRVCYLASLGFQLLFWTAASRSLNMRLLGFKFPEFSPVSLSLCPAFFSLSIAFLIAATASGRFKGWRWSAFVASIAYSWYLTNDLVFAWMKLRVFPSFLELPASFAIAVLLYYGVEKPFLRMRERMRRKLPVSAPLSNL